MKLFGGGGHHRLSHVTGLQVFMENKKTFISVPRSSQNEVRFHHHHHHIIIIVVVMVIIITNINCCNVAVCR